MLARTASLCMLVAFIVSKAHSFWLHWHGHSLTWSAAEVLLASEVCTKTYIRTSLREFDNCAKAEYSVAVRPFYKAIYSVAEEMHVCGENRCAILYMDVTDRLVYIVPLGFALAVVLVLKFGRDYRQESARVQVNEYSLPRVHRSQNMCKIKNM